MTILSLYRGFEVIVFSTVTIVTIYSIVNPKELNLNRCLLFSSRGQMSGGGQMSRGHMSGGAKRRGGGEGQMLGGGGGKFRDTTQSYRLIPHYSIQFNSIHAFISDKSPYYTGCINYTGYINYNHKLFIIN